MAPDCPLDMVHELLRSSEVLAGFPLTPLALSLLTSLPQADWITPRSYSRPSKPSQNYSHCLEYSLPFLLSSSPPCADLTCTHPCFNFKGLSLETLLSWLPDQEGAPFRRHLRALYCFIGSLYPHPSHSVTFKRNRRQASKSIEKSFKSFYEATWKIVKGHSFLTYSRT